MRKRETLIEMFSTFLRVDDYNDSLGSGWETDSRLKLSMTRSLEADLAAKEEFWAQYWLKEALRDSKNSLARSHLSAYLEEVCYWTTLKVFQQLTGINVRRVDCFFIAREAVANPAKLFKCYDSKRSRVKTYAQLPLKSAIVEKIRLGSELQKYSPTALLRAVSKKQLKEALKKADIKALESSKCLLAWQCFRERYVPSTAENSRQLQPPNAEQLAAITEAYNQRCERFNLEQSTRNQDIQRLLDISVQAIRESLRIRLISLEECSATAELIFAQAVEEQEPLTEEWQQITTILASEFQSLPEDVQKMLKLWHGLGFKQGEMAPVFGLKQQFQVSRQKGRAHQSLLKALANWSAERFQISLGSEQLRGMAAQIDEWLENHCSAPFYQFLQTNLLQEMPDEVELLQLYYGQHLNLDFLASTLNISSENVKKKIAMVKEHLQAELKSYVEKSLQLDLNSIASTRKRLLVFVETWLQKAPYATFR